MRLPIQNREEIVVLKPDPKEFPTWGFTTLGTIKILCWCTEKDAIKLDFLEEEVHYFYEIDDFLYKPKKSPFADTRIENKLSFWELEIF